MDINKTSHVDNFTNLRALILDGQSEGSLYVMHLVLID